MKKRILLWSMIGMACLMPGIIGGCAGPGVNLVKNGMVAIERIPSEKIEIPWADVYQTNGEVQVKGILRHRQFANQPLRTHVDIVLLNLDGTVLAQMRTSDVYVPHRQAGRSYNQAHFEANIPAAVSPGVVVKTIVHSDEHCQII
jgi:hypothetical protein